MLLVATMRITTTPSFSKWLLSVSSAYPFNELKATRHGFICKYVILKEENLSCWRADSFDGPILEEMIMKGRCKPLPPDMTSIMDFMLGNKGAIGKRLPQWYNAVLATLYAMLELPEPCGRKEIFTECIYYLVEELISKRYNLYSSSEGEMLMDAWLGYFNHWYDYDNSISFLASSLTSEEFVEDCIEDLDNFGMLQEHHAFFCGSGM